MAEAGGEISLHWLQVMMPLVGLLVTGVLAPFVAAFASRRFWQDDLQRLRSISETRVKRLEAVEKAVSVLQKLRLNSELMSPVVI
jgi:hypothetical protein